MAWKKAMHWTFEMVMWSVLCSQAGVAFAVLALCKPEPPVSVAMILVGCLSVPWLARMRRWAWLGAMMATGIGGLALLTTATTNPFAIRIAAAWFLGVCCLWLRELWLERFTEPT